MTVWWKPGTASALDDASVAAGRDVGATGVFRAVLDGKKLAFAADGDGFVDDSTGSRWDIFGTATSGPLEGQRLEPVPHVDTFWFAWGSYLPHTSLETGDWRPMAERHQLEQHGFVLASDTGGRQGSGLHAALGGRGMPITAFYDADGRLLDVAGGALPEQALLERLRELYGVEV